jgi:simple sugar transport system ATP-binding protein
MDAYDVRPRNVDLGTAKFSGGNQQKLVLAREAMAPESPPTVLLVSSELDEILALSDRVLVMDRGRIAGELAIADCSEAALGRLMAGVGAGQA